MSAGPADRLRAIDRPLLTRLVRLAWQNASLEVETWAVQALHGGFEALAGVYRFTGTGRDDARPLTWSLILKVICPPVGGSESDPADWNYLKRDLLAYQSGLVTDLPGSLTAPRCLEVVAWAPDEYWLWLEDVADESDPRWPLSQYQRVAQQLGQFNGAYLTARPPPAWPWLGRQWLRGLVAQAAPAMAQLPAVRPHPLVQRLYPTEVYDRLWRLWAARDELLLGLDQLPQTFCHRDAFRRNLFARRRPDGEAQTVAIDWVFAGPGALGEEAVALVIATLGFREVDLAEASDLETAVLAGYLAGLQAAGWHGDPQLVRLGYAAAAPLRYCLGGTRNLLPILLDESRHARMELMWGAPLTAFVDHWAQLFSRLLDLADEALVLSKTLAITTPRT